MENLSSRNEEQNATKSEFISEEVMGKLLKMLSKDKNFLGERQLGNIKINRYYINSLDKDIKLYYTHITLEKGDSRERDNSGETGYTMEREEEKEGETERREKNTSLNQLVLHRYSADDVIRNENQNESLMEQANTGRQRENTINTLNTIITHSSQDNELMGLNIENANMVRENAEEAHGLTINNNMNIGFTEGTETQRSNRNTLYHKHHLKQQILQQQLHEGGKPNVAFIHGFGEHSLYYYEMAINFCRQGFQAHFIDFRGFGYSLGQYKVLVNLCDLQKDLSVFINHINSLNSNPVFLYAHSMGAAVVSSFSINNPQIPIAGPRLCVFFNLFQVLL
jgi:hypothetical protein